MKTTLLSLLILIGIIPLFKPYSARVPSTLPGQPASPKEYIPDATTLDKKVMFGYQGWHATPSDGSGGQVWRHWFGRSRPDSANATFDVWPDMQEYPADVQEATNMVYPDGRRATLYSAYRYGAVDLHFKWMKEHQLDGVFQQRFLSDIRQPGGRRHFNQVVVNVKAAAEKYERVFCLMYDISGAGPNWKKTLLEDWKYMVDSLKVTQSSRYLHHKGRPLVAIWGIGFSHNSFASSAQTDSVLDWFHQHAERKYQAAVMGGVDDNWLDHPGEWKAVYDQLDVLSPWSVGRYRDDAGADRFKEQHIIPDKQYCDQKRVGYMPVIFPGFSWYNLRRGRSPFNQIPRRNGNFFWHQAYNVLHAGVRMVYIAMFDEVDEGTAMYKLAPGAAGKPLRGKFISADQDGQAVPSDWYLTLAGKTGAMLRGEIKHSPVIPDFRSVK